MRAKPAGSLRVNIALTTKMDDMSAALSDSGVTLKTNSAYVSVGIVQEQTYGLEHVRVGMEPFIHQRRKKGVLNMAQRRKYYECGVRCSLPPPDK